MTRLSKSLIVGTICASSIVAAVVATANCRPPLISVGRWVLMQDGQPAPFDDFQRGLQTSGLAWDGQLLWSVGDQRSAFAGHLFAIEAATARLIEPPMPLSIEQDDIRSLLDRWGRIDLEGIDVLSRDEHRFVILVEQEAMAAMVVRVTKSPRRAVVEAVWEFRFPGGHAPEPYRHDSNYRLEGIALDGRAGRGYVAFERDVEGRPHLYHFDLRNAPRAGIGLVPLEQTAFDQWEMLHGKPGAMLNVNSLELTHTASGKTRLFVLCRDRESVFAIDPPSGKLVGQFGVDFRSPEGERIEWASPEGIAIDSDRRVIYIISDPDSTDGNWRLRFDQQANGLFRQFVPLIFELKIPRELLQDATPSRSAMRYNHETNNETFRDVHRRLKLEVCCFSSAAPGHNVVAGRPVSEVAALDGGCHQVGE